MRLISLKLAGFKSFADSTTLVFADNRTAVVGPNGCGKSNVIDAIRWVMGESSARQLRGGAMTDVIFAGTAQRKPVGQASVELRFENTLGKLGGAYNAYTELAVRRQVNRDGRSDYFLNGTRCRRRDITDIFLGTGLGPRSYAIIEQGMINRLVDAKPEEMRVFIEEAAGVSRYQARRRETLHHLEHTRQNLSRLQDISDELQAQIRSLHRQSQAALRYQKLEKQQRHLSIALWSAHYRQAERTQQQHTVHLTQLGEQYRQLRGQRQQAEAEWQASSQQLSTLLASAEPLQQAWQQAERELHQWQASHQQAQQAQTQRDQQQQDWLHRLASMVAQVKDDQQRLLELDHEFATNQTQLKDAEHTSQEGAAQLVQLEHSLQQIEQQWQSTQQQHQRWQQQQQRLQQQVESAGRSRLWLEQQLQQLNQQLQQLQIDQQQDDLALLIEELDALARDKNRLEQQLKHQLDSLAQCRQQLEPVQAHLANQQAVLLSCETELRAIQNLQAQVHSFEKSNKQAETAQTVTPLLHQLQLSEAAQPHVALIEKFLADWLNALHCDRFIASDLALNHSTRTAARYYRSHSDHSHSDYNNGHNQNPHGLNPHNQTPLGTATTGTTCLQHADVQPLDCWIVQPLLSCWQAVGIVVSHQQALSLQSQLNPQQSLLTLDGFWLGQDWQINLNIDEQAARQHGMLQQQLRQQQLREQQQALIQTIEPLGQTHQQLQQQAEQLSQQLTPIQQQVQQLAQRQQQLDLQRARLDSNLHANQRQQQQLEQQIHALQHTQQDDHEQLAEWHMELAGLTLRLNQLKPQLDEQTHQLNTIKQQSQQARLAHQLQQQQLQNYLSRQQQLVLQQQAIRQSLDRAEPQQQQLEQQLAQLTIINQQAAEQQPEQLEQLAAAQQLATQAHQQWSHWQQQLDICQKQQQQRGELRQQGQAQEDQLRDQLEQTRLYWQDCKNKMQQAIEQLQEWQAEPLIDEHDPANESFANESLVDKSHAIEKSHAPTAVEDWQAQLDSVQQQIKKLGHLNLAAPDALTEVSERHAELNHQMQDLQQTVEQLEQAMKQIDQETRSLFMQTFDRVNQELKLLFPKVFGGGEASLSLEDDWQSGVRLMARPPGKRNSSLALLSGGEKALTALALVFAIFRLNPAPFCVLDEVDAPLDDANVQRFCHLVTELSQQVQFIYITHNKLAMTMATDLLGVTMPEPGASRLVAVNIEQAATFSATSE